MATGKFRSIRQEPIFTSTPQQPADDRACAGSNIAKCWNYHIWLPFLSSPCPAFPCLAPAVPFQPYCTFHPPRALRKIDNNIGPRLNAPNPLTPFYPAKTTFPTGRMLAFHFAHSKAPTSNGTVLPLPARYRFPPPPNALGMGSWASGWNLNLESEMGWGLPPPLPLPPPVWAVLREEPRARPLVRVYAEGSSEAVVREALALRGCDGGGGAGGGAEPIARPPAVGMPFPPVALGGGGGGGGGLGALGGGGGGAEGVGARLVPNALRAAVSARLGSREGAPPLSWGGAEGGGAGGVRMLGVGGGRGAAVGGGGGAAGGTGLVLGGGAGAVDDEGFREEGGGTGGFLPMGGGGLGLVAGRSEVDWVAAGEGLRPPLRAATPGGGGGAAAEGGGGGIPPGGRGAAPFGLGGGAPPPLGLGRLLSLSPSESTKLTAPPVFRSLGMPTPAKIPPSCGAASAPVDADALLG